MADITDDSVTWYEGTSIVTGDPVRGTDPKTTHPYPDGRPVTRLYRPDTGKSSDVFSDTLREAAPGGDTRAASVHWHVSRHAEDDDVYAAADLFAALDYAAGELDRIAEHEHDAITSYGEAGLFEPAYIAFKTSERIAGLAANARTAHHQGTAPLADRAPLYQNPDETVNARRAEQYARHTVDAINAGANDFRVYECTDVECVPADD